MLACHPSPQSPTKKKHCNAYHVNSLPQGTSDSCELFHVPTDEEPKDFEYYMAGTTCKDWSSMGGGATLSGKSVLPFSVELQLIKRTGFETTSQDFNPIICSNQ